MEDYRSRIGLVCKMGSPIGLKSDVRKLEHKHMAAKAQWLVIYASLVDRVGGKRRSLQQLVKGATREPNSKPSLY